MLRSLRERYAEAISHITVQHLAAARTERDRGRPVGTMAIATIIGFQIEQSEYHERSFEQALNELKERRRLFQSDPSIGASYQ